MNHMLTLLSFLSALNLASSAAIYHTVHQTVYVTVDVNGNIQGDVATPLADAPSPTPIIEVTPSVEVVAPSPTDVGAQQEVAVESPPAESPSVEVPVPDAGSSNIDSFAQSIVDYHNQVRSQHGAEALTWDDSLASYASNYLAGANCNFAHSNGPYGENLAMGYSDATSACKAWYDESSVYNYAAATFSSSTGHFTQMIWKGTTSVGCAQVACGGGNYLVCEYAPRGNVLGQFNYNVQP